MSAVGQDEIQEKHYYFNGIQVNGPRFGSTPRQMIYEDLVQKFGTDAQALNDEVRRLQTLPTEHTWLLEALGGKGANILTSPGAVMIQQVSSGESDKFRNNIIFGLDALQSAADCLRSAVVDKDTGLPLCFDLPDQIELATDFIKSVNAWALSGLGNESLYQPNIEQVINQALQAYERAQDSGAQAEYEPIVLDQLVDKMATACDGVDVALVWQRDEGPTAGLHQLSSSFEPVPLRAAHNTPVSKKTNDRDFGR